MFTLLNFKYIFGIFLALQVVRCSTDYEKFSLVIKEGVDAETVEEYLNSNGLNYSFMSCNELERRPGSPRRTCHEDDSIGTFVGMVNDGSYMLGIGFTDVIYLIEIAPNNKVSYIHLEYGYTFL